MPVNYEEVLADLRQMKADAEAGITAIERLMARSSAPGQNHQTVGAFVSYTTPGLPPQKKKQPYSDGIPERVNRFLQSQPGGSYSIMDIAKAIGATNIQTLRGALGRMVKSGKAGKQGRGLYRAPRQPHRVSLAPEDVKAGPG